MSRFGLGFVSGLSGTPGNDSFTKILLHMEGPNGGGVVTDSSASGVGRTWSTQSSVTSTAAFKFGTSSLLTTAGYVTAANSADFTLGSSDWTIDFWLNCAGTGGNVALAGQGQTVGVVSIQRTTANKISASVGNGPFFSITGGTSVNDSFWRHIALVRSGGTLSLYVGGTKDASDVSISGTIADGSNSWSVGRTGDSTIPAASSCFFDEFRLSVGIARWTSNFTPPTQPYI